MGVKTAKPAWFPARTLRQDGWIGAINRVIRVITAWFATNCAKTKSWFPAPNRAGT